MHFRAKSIFQCSSSYKINAYLCKSKGNIMRKEMEFFQSCKGKFLAVALFLCTTLITAQTPFEVAMSQTSFSKKDFADTIKIRIFDGAIIVPVEVEGKTRHLVFDTGAQSGAWYTTKEDWMKPVSNDSVTIYDINKKEQKQLLYKAPSIKLGNLIIENYPLVQGDGMVPYSCGVFDGALGFDLVSKGLSFKLDTKDSLLIVTDRKGFFAEEEKNSPFVKYKLVRKTKPVVPVQSPIGKMAAVFDTGAIRVWLELPQRALDNWLARYPKKRKDIDALTVQKDSTVNTNIGLHGVSNDTIEERVLHFPSIMIGSLPVNDLYISTACHSLGIGTALLMHTSMIIDAPKKRFVFLPHEPQTELSVDNKEIRSLSFVPAEEGDSLGVLKAIVRKGSTAYQKGIRTGDYLIEVNGTSIKDRCTYMQMEGKFEETSMTLRSPDGKEKQVTVKRTF